MIRVTGGAAVYHDGQRKHVVTPADGPVSLSPELERRFVSLGVATYVDAEGPVPESAPEIETSTDSETESQPEVEGSRGYSDMGKKDLMAELNRRGIPFKAKENRAALISKLEKDDADEAPAFDALGALG